MILEKLSNQDKNKISEMVSKISKGNWVYDIIEQLPMGKAPGPDGIPNEFYYIFRHKKDFITLLEHVFKEVTEKGFLPECMSTTYYKLLYKKGTYSAIDLEQGLLDNTAKDPRNLSNWRPIALLSCDSKILSAYMAENLKHNLENVISNTQSAFIPGRQIHTNIMLIQQN